MDGFNKGAEAKKGESLVNKPAVTKWRGRPSLIVRHRLPVKAIVKGKSAYKKRG